jgi:hypothetical protein
MNPHKCRLSFVQFEGGSVKTPTGVMKDGAYEKSKHYVIDRDGDTIILSNPIQWKDGETHIIPWSAVKDSIVDAEYETKRDSETMATDVLGGRADAMAGAFPGQRVDGRTRAARAAKAGEP